MFRNETQTATLNMNMIISYNPLGYVTNLWDIPQIFNRVSGFNPNLVELVLSLDILNFNPWDYMIKILGTKYDYLDSLFLQK